MLNLVDFIQSLCAKILLHNYQSLGKSTSTSERGVPYTQTLVHSLAPWCSSSASLRNADFKWTKIWLDLSGRVWFIFHNFISFSKIQKEEGIMPE